MGPRLSAGSNNSANRLRNLKMKHKLDTTFEFLEGTHLIVVHQLHGWFTVRAKPTGTWSIPFFRDCSFLRLDFFFFSFPNNFEGQSPVSKWSFATLSFYNVSHQLCLFSPAKRRRFSYIVFPIARQNHLDLGVDSTGCISCIFSPRGGF